MTSNPARSAQTTPRLVGACARAFTLIEMLTVLGILAIVIAIIIPAMNMARRSAKNADVKVTLTQLGRACDSFQVDQRRLPGYFSARQMGAMTNGTIGGAGRGFTSIENIMLDLMGGVTTQASDHVQILEVGPDASKLVNVDIGAMGSTTQNKSGAVSRGYVPMDGKRFVAQNGMNGAGQRNAIGTTDHDLFPTPIDSFGQPILAWAKDEIPRPTTGPNSSFAYTNSDGHEGDFYWAQNVGFLGSQKLGKMGESQRFFGNTNPKTGSVLGSNGSGQSEPSIQNTLEALLGNASNPDPNSATAHPLTPRAPIVFHSAGADGVYLNVQDRGARSGSMQYQPNQDPMGGSLFDDIIATGGN